MSDEDIHEGVDEREPQVERIYIVSRLFTQTVNGVRVEYKKGRVVRDPVQIAMLLEARAPVVEVLNEDDLGVCPHCGLSFSLSAQEGSRELLRRARQLMPGYV